MINKRYTKGYCKEPWNKGKKTGPANFSEEHREKLRQRMILMNKTRRNKNGKKD